LKAAVVTDLGRLPEVTERDDPVPEPGEALVDVEAVPLNPLDVNVAAGRFYRGPPPLPFVPGAEGVGIADGGRVWIFGAGLGITRDGTLAERVAAPRDALFPVPDGADPAIAAALGIGGISGWLPLVWRAPLRGGETVVVLGATGSVGMVAVQTAKVLGAGRVVAVGRRHERLDRVRALGADATVTLDKTFADALREACPDGADVIFDPLWGEPLANALAVANPRARIVNMGQSAGPEATLASSVVRGKELEIIGYSTLVAPRDVLAREYARLVEHAVSGAIVVEPERVPLSEIADAWQRQASGEAGKLVVVP
jgi:NADPH2:quinone reductase